MGVRPMFDLHISTDNAAFEENPMTEIARILRELAKNLEDGRGYNTLRDSNGNTVGDGNFKT